MTSDQTARRIALAWRELRRGATGAVIRAHLLGPDAPPLEQAQLDALEILASQPDGLRMGEFADALRVDPSVATRAVERLVSVGLAERHREASDGRVVVARATATGRSTAVRVTRRRAAGMERLLEPFDVREREQLADLLERFVISIDDVVSDLAGTTSTPNR